MKFKSYLKEAAFSPAKIEQVIKLIERVLEKRLGKLYRWGGSRGIQVLDKGIGYLYFLKNKRGFRINFSGGKIVTVDIWKQYAFGENPDFTIDLNGHNIVQVVSKIADIIKSPQTGKVEVEMAESTILDVEKFLIAEAKRVTVDQFKAIVFEVLGRTDNLTRQDIKDIASARGVGIPTEILREPKYKQVRGKFTLNVNTDAAPSRTTSTKKDDGGILYVLGRDAKGRVFKPSSEQVEKALEKEVASRISSPEPQPGEMDDPDTLFGNMVALTRMVARGSNPSLLIYGGPGTGKTFLVKDTLKKSGKAQGSDWVMVKGKTTPAGIYRTLYINRDKIVVFDDSDSVFRDQDSRNILKAVLDSYDERVVSWVSNRTVDISGMTPDEKAEFDADTSEKIRSGKDAKMPSEYEFKGGIIFISNLKEDAIEPAILSRSFKIDMTLTDAAMFKRMASIIEHIGGDELADISLDDKQLILNTLKERNALGQLKRPNMRTFVAACRIFQSGVDNWFDLIKYS